METKHLQILKPFITKCSKGTLPVLYNAFVQNGKLVYSDLEIWVSFPTTLPDGLYTHIEGEFFKNEGHNIDDYPEHPLTGKVNFLQKVTLYPDKPASPLALAHLAACVAADELRPVMNSVYITSNHMVASDAHVLKVIPVDESQVVSEGLNDKGETLPIEFLTPVPQVLVSALKKYPNCPVNITKYVHPEDSNYTGTSLRYTFVDEGFEIIIRETEGNYPNIKSAMPNIKEYEHAVSFSHQQITEFHKFAQKISDGTNRLLFNNNVPVTSNTDTGIKKTFQEVEVTGIPEREPDGLIMPFILNGDQQADDKAIAINTQNMVNITSGFKGTITLARNTDPSKACYVWLTPANQKAASRKPASKPKHTTQKHDIPAAPQPATSSQQPAASSQYIKRIIWQAA